MSALPPTTNTGTWAPKQALSDKRKEEGGAAGVAKKPKAASSSDPLGEPPPWTSRRPESISVSTADAAPAAASPKEAASNSPVGKDEIQKGAPRLAEHIKNPGKLVKVAAMATTLLEEGRVNVHNSEAFFEVLDAGMCDPKRIREKGSRQAMRRLYSAALAKKEVFAVRRQATLRLWQMRIINQIDLHAKADAEQVLRICRELRQGLMLLPCLDPSLEPPARAGQRREMMPATARPVWAEALFECLDVAMTTHLGQEWAKNDLNMLVKTAHDRRQNFTDAQADAILQWNRKRKDGASELKQLFA